MKNKQFTLCWVKAGYISEQAGWVLMHSRWLYGVKPSLIKLLWMVLTQWKDDRHLIG